MKNILNYFLVLFLSFCFQFVNATSTQWHRVDSLKTLAQSTKISSKERAYTTLKLAKLYFDLGDFQIAEKNYKSSILLLDSQNEYFSKLKAEVELGMMYQKTNAFDKSLMSYFSALKTINSIDSLSNENRNIFKGIVLMDMSVIFGEVQYYDVALNYGLEAEELLAHADSISKAASASNIGAIYLGLRQPKRALTYFQKSIDYYKDISNDVVATAYTNLGTIYLETKSYQKAIDHYQKALNYYNQSTDLFNSERAGLLANMANVHANMGNFNKSKIKATEASKIVIEKNGGKFFEQVYESLVKLYSITGDTNNAFTNLTRLNEIKDSVYNHEILNNIIEIQREHERQKIEEQNQIKIRLIQQDQIISRYKWYTLSGFLLILLLITLLIVFRINHKNNVSKIELKNIKLETEQLGNQLQFKNKELTNFALYIIKKNELLQRIKGEIDDITDSNNTTLKSISSAIQLDINSSKDRKDFEVRVEAEYQDFFYKLQKKYPDLTEKDKKLCSLLLLDLSSKDIAKLMNIASSSVDKSRYRLRKKLGIESDINFSTYLKNL